MEFRKKLEALLNAESKENGSDTPDFILAGYLDSCLRAFDQAVNSRSGWYGEGTKDVHSGKVKQEVKEEPNG